MTASVRTINGADFDPIAVRVTHSIVMIDAATARRWLSSNTNNRNVRQTIVERYRNDMVNGRWTFAGDPIRFGVDGVMQDGQHRLLALAETDLTLPMLVIRGLPAESMRVMDQGARRTPGDQLSLRGVKDANAIAAAVRQYLVWSDGYLFRDNKTTTAAISTPRIEQWTIDNPADVAYLGSVLSLVKQNWAPPSVAGAAAIGFGRIDEASSTQFFTLLARGAGAEGHPITTLDKRLQRIKRDGLKIPPRDYLALFIQSWNAWREGRTRITQFLRPRGAGWHEGNFPEPK